MKKIVPFLAIVLALTFSAFTKSSNQSDLTPMYWYDLSGNSLGHGINPNNGCVIDGTGCAIGFVVEPVDPLLETPDGSKRLN